MKQNTLRVLLKAKRQLASATRYRPSNSVSLNRQEKPNGISFEILASYSEALIAEINDPRSGLNRGHLFEPRNAYVVRNIIFEPRLGLIYSKDGNLIEESTNWPIFQFYNSFPWNPSPRLKKIHLDSAIFLTSSAFGHWLMEDLPLTVFALGLHPKAPILVASNPPKFVSDFLKLIDREVIYLDGPVEVDSLIFVQKNQDSGWPHPKDLETLNQFEPFSLAKSKKSPERKIYTSRQGSKRSPRNEAAIEGLFRDSGFEVFRMETLDLLDEIQLMSETAIIAGVHGSALSNIIWMPHGGLMIDIVNDDYWTEAGHRLAHFKTSTYEYVKYYGAFESEISIVSLENELELIRGRHPGLL